MGSQSTDQGKEWEWEQGARREPRAGMRTRRTFVFQTINAAGASEAGHVLEALCSQVQVAHGLTARSGGRRMLG